MYLLVFDKIIDNIALIIHLCKIMHINKQNNPLKKRRLRNGFSQKQMSEFIGITQSQYSRIEKGESDITKHLKSISEVFKCEVDEVFSKEILSEIEDELFNVKTKVLECLYHEKKLNSVYLKMEGWFTKEELRRNFEFMIEGLESSIEEEYDEKFD